MSRRAVDRISSSIGEFYSFAGARIRSMVLLGLFFTFADYATAAYDILNHLGVEENRIFLELVLNPTSSTLTAFIAQQYLTIVIFGSTLICLRYKLYGPAFFEIAALTVVRILGASSNVAAAISWDLGVSFLGAFTIVYSIIGVAYAAAVLRRRTPQAPSL